MKIGLVDVDGHNFPNLALMKLSAWEKKQGHEVEFVNNLLYYDKVYKSKVFTFSEDDKTVINSPVILKGGTGYNLQNKLSPNVESVYPDYELYGIKNTAYGFLTRGCPRDCDFCIVAEKEGKKSYKVADLEQFWRGQKEIKLLDPNLLASKNHVELLVQLIESNALIDITQGLDARLLTDENTELIKRLKLKVLHFAWDKTENSDLIISKLESFKTTTKIGYRKLKVYVLVNFDTTIEEDLYRIYKLKELGYDPFIMIFEKWKASKDIKRLARWVNNKYIFRTCDKFEDYK